MSGLADRISMARGTAHEFFETGDPGWKDLVEEIRAALGLKQDVLPSKIPGIIRDRQQELFRVQGMDVAAWNDEAEHFLANSEELLNKFAGKYIPDGYISLAEVLEAALEQAAGGKGKERHAKDREPFDRQKICEITRRVGLGYPLGQAIKKAEESLRLGERGPDELLGAINYLAAAVIVMQEQEQEYHIDEAVSNFIDHQCQLCPAFEADRSILAEEFTNFCGMEGCESPFSFFEFSEELKKRGVVQHKDDTEQVFRGIGLTYSTCDNPVRMKVSYGEGPGHD